MNEVEIDKEAKRLFAIVKGPGDAGSEREFYAQSDTQGWNTVGYEMIKLRSENIRLRARVKALKRLLKKLE
jgi:hypothetical protein